MTDNFKKKGGGHLRSKELVKIFVNDMPDDFLDRPGDQPLFWKKKNHPNLRQMLP